jgi:hypothetical protein
MFIDGSSACGGDDDVGDDGDGDDGDGDGCSSGVHLQMLVGLEL